jgi:hypothetical protein
MILNLDTNIEEESKKICEYLAKYEQLEEQIKTIHFVTIKEFAKMRGCSIKIAQDIFNLPDFPSEDFGKEKVVSIEALKKFYMSKRSKKDYE